MTALQTTGTFVADRVRGRVPAATRALAQLHLTDTIGAWIAGARTTEGQALLAAAPNDGHAIDLATACALARLSEIDNIHLASSTTPGGIIIPAALTIAASRPDIDATALIEAIVAGTEAMVRLGAAVGGPKVLYRGIWPTYWTAPFGVAAVAARLNGLDAQQSAHALALALTLASPGVGHHNAATTSRWFAIGNAARNGLVAARAAQAGFTSDLRLLDGEFLHGIYGITPDLAAFTEGLGERWAFDDISFKPWCAARQTMAATQALTEIIASGVAPGSVTSVVVHVPPPYLKMVDHGVSTGDRASHLTSVPYLLAVAACDPRGLFDVQQSPPQLAPDVQAWMQKVSVAADEELLKHYPKSWPARVVVQTAGGTHEKTVLHVPGDPQRPFGQPQLDDKLRRVLGPAAGPAEALLARHSSNPSPAALAAEIAQLIGHPRNQ